MHEVLFKSDWEMEVYSFFFCVGHESFDQIEISKEAFLWARKQQLDFSLF